LVTNIAGRPYPRKGLHWANHFDPWSPIFTSRQRAYIALSDVALAGVIYGLHRLRLALGWGVLLKVYLVPYLIVNFWLVLITLLQVRGRLLL
jgi:omega-6 fatty acid desaturase / acyl-lipid omega-6 desaturase (Delta-12 desaturase)